MIALVKVVGRRSTPDRVSPEEALAWQTRAAEMFGRRPLCPRGVFRFSTFDEAEAWMTNHLVARGHEALRKTTSFVSREA